MKRALHGAILLALVFSAGAVRGEEADPDEELTRLAQSGDASAQWAMGNRELLRGKYENSATWYEKSAEQGAQASQYMLSMMYLNGIGRAKSNADAVKWLNKALLNPNQHAISTTLSPEVVAVLAKRKDDGGKKLDAFIKKAEAGDACAQALLGMILKEGWLGDAKGDEGEKWLRKAADQNFVYAQMLLGSMYSDGHGLEPNREEGLKWYRKAAAQNDPQSCFLLGLQL